MTPANNLAGSKALYQLNCISYFVRTAEMQYFTTISKSMVLLVYFN